MPVTKAKAKSQNGSPRRLLTTEEAAELVGLAPQTLAVWRCKKRYDLPYVKIGNRVRYRPEDIAAWLDANSSSGGGEITGEVTGQVDD